jgi:putative hydrolase of the HAD superfamily
MAGPTASPAFLVVFDIDDTLYLERDYVRSGFQAVGAWARQALDLPDLAHRARAAFEDGVRGRIFDVALAGGGVEATPELIAQLVAHYRDHVPDIELLADARACLDGLALDPEVVVAVISDGPLASQQAKARSLGLETWSQHVTFTEALGAGFGKPHPRAFELVEQRVGVSSDRCVYVADNPGKDFIAPHQRGWRTVRVRREHGLHFDAASGEDVHHEAADLSGLCALLGRERL